MAFARPSFPELVTRVSGDMRSQLLAAGKRADSFLARTKMWVLARVYAAIFHVLYGALQWISLQILPSTATDLDYLIAYGLMFGVERKVATKSEGVVTFTGDDGSIIPEGTEFVREDGLVYVTTAEGEIDGTGEVDVAAESDLTGALTVMTSGTALALSESVSGVDSEVTWASGFDDGTDDESFADLKTRILERMRSTPQGGAADDYVAWAREVAGVYRALCVPLARGAGTVDVYFLVSSGGVGNGVPSSGQIDDVQAYLDVVRPVTADVLVKAPTTVTVDVDFATLDPNTGDIQDAIEAALESMLAAQALLTTTIQPSAFYAALDAIPGLNGWDMDDPAGPITCAAGEIFVLGTVTWPS